MVYGMVENSCGCVSRVQRKGCPHVQLARVQKYPNEALKFSLVVSY